MKILFLSLLFFICCTGMLFADFLSPLNAGAFLDEGGISSPSLIKNNDGSLFLLYIKAGDLVVLQSSDGGESFAAVDTAGLGFENVNELSFISGVNEEPFIIVQATRNSIPGLYSLIFNEEGNLAPAFANSLILDTVSGSLGEYQIRPGNMNNYLLYYFKGGALCITHFSLIMNTLEKKILSGVNEIVTDLRQHIRFVESSLVFYGLYFTEEGENKLFHYFEIDMNNILMNEVICQTPLAVNYEIYTDPGEVVHLNYLLANKIYGHKLISGTWGPVNKGAVITDMGSSPGVSFFSRIIPLDSRFMAFNIAGGGAVNQYLVARDENGNIKNPGESVKINGTSFTGESIVLQVFRDIMFSAFTQIDNGKDMVVINKLAAGLGEVVSVSCPGQLTETAVLKDFSLSLVERQKLVLFEELEEGRATVLQFYEFEGSANGFVKKLRRTFPHDEGILNNTYLENDIFFNVFDNKTVLIDTHSWANEEATSAAFIKIGDNIKESSFVIKTVGGQHFLLKNDSLSPAVEIEAVPDEIIEIAPPVVE